MKRITFLSAFTIGFSLVSISIIVTVTLDKKNMINRFIFSNKMDINASNLRTVSAGGLYRLRGSVHGLRLHSRLHDYSQV